MVRQAWSQFDVRQDLKRQLLPPGPSAVYALAVAVDGEQVAVGYESGDLLLVQQTSGAAKLLRKAPRDLEPHTVRVVFFSADGKLILWGCNDNLLFMHSLTDDSGTTHIAIGCARSWFAAR